jgi:integrase/recombinase XerD
MDYIQIKRRYIRFLRLERNYSQNTVDAYSHDIDYLLNFLNGEGLAVEEVRLAHLEQFATLLHEFGIAASSQARILCGVRSFFRFLLLDGTLQDDPSELLESPTLGEHLPEVLSTEEIDRMEASIDLSKPEGQRNRAIIEVLCAVEAHVFEEVSQTTLRLFLLDSAHFLCNVEVGTVLRPVVVADVVGQTIVQLANHYVGVSRNG